MTVKNPPRAVAIAVGVAFVAVGSAGENVDAATRRALMISYVVLPVGLKLIVLTLLRRDFLSIAARPDTAAQVAQDCPEHR